MKKIFLMCVGILLTSMFTPPLAVAQRAAYEVSGVVVDQSGMPLLGVTVLERGTLNGVSTGIDGDYRLRVAGPEAVVEISFIGSKSVALVDSSTELRRVFL